MSSKAPLLLMQVVMQPLVPLLLLLLLACGPSRVLQQRNWVMLQAAPCAQAKALLTSNAAAAAAAAACRAPRHRLWSRL